MNRTKQVAPDYSLGPTGEFIIENYNASKPFASFFPGIAGPHGIPMWVFYVNRAQCLCSIGIEDKEHPIMEFLSANRAYQLTSTQGFRTLLKIKDRGGFRFYEPFQNHLADEGMTRTQRMVIHPAELLLEEQNQTLGLTFSVDYFNVPGDTYAGLVRVLKIKNTGTKTVSFEGLDGLPLIIPYGVDNYNLKHMRRLVESFVEVINYEHDVPYFKGRVRQEDRPEVTRIKEGNFYLGFVEGAGGPRLVKPVVDPEQVFGSLTDYSYPKTFLDTADYRVPARQILENRLPCALGLVSATLSPGKTYTYTSIIGSATTVQQLNRLVPRIACASYVERKRRENADLIEQLSQNNFINSSSVPFNLYSRQNFVDNTLRGGLPISLPDGKTVTTLHLYSRKHGDLERDYNDYRLSASTYSQGNGSFRDINQNRRNDLLINPDVREGNVEHFFNLMQTDGFNPLIVKSTSFRAKSRRELDRVLRAAMKKSDAARVAGWILNRRFAPGQLMSYLHDEGIRLKGNPDVFMGEVLGCCSKHQETDVGHGYWSDHWHYNLDLLENYLAVYPENLGRILMDRKTFTFFDNPHRVLPRKDKYVLWDGLPMQLGAVITDAQKSAMLRLRGDDANVVRTKKGQGEIYRTTLVAKLLCIIANKLGSLDPAGVGIEMESDKPNWYDALNGLPGQLGSSISETLELKRHVLFVLNAMDSLRVGDSAAVKMFDECARFITALRKLLESDGGAGHDFLYWEKASSLKEAYRDETLMGISGRESAMTAGELRAFLKLAVRKLDRGIAKARDRKTGILSTYFINKVVAYDLILEKGPGGKKVVKKNPKGQPCFRAKRFKQIPLPLFLEGPVHYLRMERDPAKAADLARRVRASGLFDRKLKMYKVNESLAGQPMEIGRTRIFSPGWLENESIWLHMEYKYLLELLRCGLHKEFYQDAQTMLVPYLDPAVYGRSILENSSFIASSANPDSSIHGNGFVARLSGSTAEFIHILLLISFGERPFRLGAKGQLELCFEPAIPASLFTRKPTKVPVWQNGKRRMMTFAANTFACSFLGNTIVTYHNPRRGDTFGRGAVKPKRWTLTPAAGKAITVDGAVVTGKVARLVRERRISRIDIELG